MKPAASVECLPPDGNSLLAVSPAGIGLRLTFVRGDDRFSHRLDVLVGEHWQTCLTSIEGNSAEPWPDSPPLQQLHFEARPDDRAVALLVGMAGKSHWSAAVETDSTSACLTFDVACRTSLPPARLGSRYLAAGRVELVDATVLIEVDGAIVIAEIVPTAGVSGGRLIATDGGLEFVCQDLPVKLPATVRWQYRFRAVMAEPSAAELSPRRLARP